MKKITAVIICSLIVMNTLLLSGCNKKDATGDISKTSESSKQENVNKSVYPLTITDDSGQTITLKEKPQRVAVLSTTFIGIHYATGGTAIAKSSEKSGGSPIPEEAKKIDSVGMSGSIDLEKLISEKPDFVIGQVGLHEKLLDSLKSANIPCVLLKMKSYDDVIKKLELFGKLNDKVDKANALIKTVEDKKNDIVNKLPKKETKIAILFVTSQDVQLKLDNSIAGNVASILKLKNITSGITPPKAGTENIPFSMEKIIENDPDVIFVTMMGTTKELAEQEIKKDLEVNPAWSGLRAVKEKKIVYLPEDLFLYNRGDKFTDSIEYMAKAVYPDVYGKIEP